jgi:hypothetical protein
MASRPVEGASRMPDSAANAEPIIHACVRTRAGLVPARSRRSGLSTTPRMATPVFENRKNE